MPDFSQVKNNSKRLLDYISALAKRRQKCVDNFESHSSWHKYKNEFMNPNNEILPGIKFNQPTEDAWIIIKRLEKKNPPNFHNKDILTKWQIKIPDDPNKEPQYPEERIVNSAEQIEIDQWIGEGILRQDNITCPADDGSFDVRFLWEDDKNAQQEFKEYLDKWWQPWQLLEKPRRKTIKTYNNLYPICKNMKSPDEEYPVEVVFAVGVAQKWENGDVICKNPVIEQVVEMKLDDRNSDLIIYPNESRKPTISLQSYQDNPSINAIKEILEGSLTNEEYELNPFDNTTFSPIIEKARTVLDAQAVLSDKAVSLAKPEMLSFHSEWAIFIRQRDDSQILIRTAEKFKANIEKMEDFSDFPDVLTRIAGGLEIADEVWSSFSKTKQTVINGDIPTDNDRSNKSTENLYFPLPYNEQQKKIIHTLSREDCSGMVVQGPPGTGKSHTIANIICHCLATGKRVLVASHDIPALEVLEEKIPEGIRDLVIPVLSKDSDGKKKIEIAINRLLSISHDTDPQEIAKDIKNKECEEAQLKKKITLTTTKIIKLAKRQIENPPDFLISGPNIQGDDISITETLAKWVVSAMPEFDWFKDRPSPDNFGNLPFDNSDIEQLRSAREILGEDLRYTGEKFPAVETLPALEIVRDWHENLLRAAKIEKNMNDGDIARFSESSFDIIQQAKDVKEKLEKLIQAYNNFSNATWINNLPITDTEQGNYPNLRKELKHLSQQYGKIINKGVVNHSNFPAVVNNSHILDILDKKSKNKLAWGYAFPTKTKKDINNFRINDQSPKSPKDWEHLYSFTSWLLKCQTFITQWNANAHLWTRNDDIKAPSIENINTIAEWLNEKNKAITGAETATQLKEEIKPSLENLFQDNTTGMITEITGIKGIIKSIDGNIDKIKMEQYKNEIDSLSNNLGDADISKIMHYFLNNRVGNSEINSQDIMKEWEYYRGKIKKLQEKQEYFNTVLNVTNKIKDAGAVKWATILKEQAAEQEIDSLLPHNWRDIWQWSCADKWLDERENGREIKSLLKQLRDIEDQRKQKLSEIVELRAKQKLKEELDNNPVAVSNLNTFSLAIRKTPRGIESKKAPYLRRTAREAMKKCYQAIPCWIMPSWRANEMLPDEMGAFDLVIMDETSQSDVTEVITLIRGKKALIVGDEKQVSPTVIAQEEQIQNIINANIIGLPGYKILHPQFSLYEIFKTIYTQPIMLREHFRCAEPIIAFSSRMFYENNIIPLRVPTIIERISPPLVDVFVEDGVRIGNENTHEANAIVNEIISIRENTNLRCRSIGVISLVGYLQARYIYNLLSEKMGINHGIKCGTAASFQGKECDIIFLSMVVSPGNCLAATGRDTGQRYNVAASRARDRLYLYRSVKANDLKNSEDLRYILLGHFENPMPNAQNLQAAGLCQSGFEKEFFTKLVKSGYVATPQVGSKGYKIDIVVEGENGNRLAIELDGDKYHQDWEKDFNRQQILERVGWRFWRCFASSYYRKKEEVFQDLLNTLEESDIYPWEPTESDTTQYVEHRSVKGMENKEEGTDGTKQFAL